MKSGRAFSGVVVAVLAVPLQAGSPAGRGANGGEVTVAVAANFADTHRELAGLFERATGHRVVASLGSSGLLYAQIRNGAPVDVFLSADAERPRELEATGYAVRGTRFVYAEGRLALFGPGFDQVRAGGSDLLDARVRRVALPNPRIAPYGVAALEVLERLGLADRLASKLVRGESVTQAFQFVKTGAVELGFVAWSQVLREPPHTYWLVPREAHAPILQEAVLLTRGAQNPAALAYMAFLRSANARRVIESHGYATPDPAR